MMKSIVLFTFLLWTIFGYSQQKKVAHLPIELNEASGMIFISDTSFIIHNDSENPTRLYEIDTNGNFVKTVEINFHLQDFEAIARKGNILYLGDIGNNRNNRNNLRIIAYDWKQQRVLSVDTIRYPEQNSYPPREDSLYFDAEAMVFKGDSLLIFTKNRTHPFNGISFIYSIDLKTHKAKLVHRLSLEKMSWLRSSVTDVAYQNKKFYVLTYKFIYVLDQNYRLLKKFSFGGIQQREGIAVDAREKIYIVTEKNKYLGGGKLYRLKIGG